MEEIPTKAKGEYNRADAFKHGYLEGDTDLRRPTGLGKTRGSGTAHQFHPSVQRELRY